MLKSLPGFYLPAKKNGSFLVEVFDAFISVLHLWVVRWLHKMVYAMKWFLKCMRSSEWHLLICLSDSPAGGFNGRINISEYRINPPNL